MINKVKRMHRRIAKRTLIEIFSIKTMKRRRRSKKKFVQFNYYKCFFSSVSGVWQNLHHSRTKIVQICLNSKKTTKILEKPLFKSKIRDRICIATVFCQKIEESDQILTESYAFKTCFNKQHFPLLFHRENI